MSGKKGMIIGPKIKFSEIQGQYEAFCRNRKDVQNLMPEFRLNLFTERVFDGVHFELIEGE